ncbi:MAG TPA: GAF domain-containing protein [Solirubrobacteraceae bacterium]|jgi:signal transduction histidine kinase
MPHDSWLALDASTSPATRARELRQDWEHFVTEGRVNGVRGPVAASWRRSLDAGVDPAGGSLAPVAADRAEAIARWDVHPLSGVADLIRDRLETIAARSEHLIVVSDASGVLLQVDGDAGVRSRAADSMNFTEGALWSETGAGTNAIGTALAADHAVQIFATEHFVEVVQAWTCSAAPVHDPETGELLGVIDLTGLEKHVRPDSLLTAVRAARAVEGYLRERLEQRDNQLRARYEAGIAGRSGRRALVSPTGRVVADLAGGWLSGVPFELPAGGGELVLPSGVRVVAEPVGGGEALVMRELGATASKWRPGRSDGRVLDDEQTVLRRLATAVARDVSPEDIFKAVAAEVRPLLGAEDAAVSRYEPDHTARVMAWSGRWVAEVDVDAPIELDDSLAITAVFRTGRSARVEHHDYSSATGVLPAYLRRTRACSAVASPITVDGRLWGVLAASTNVKPLPADAEQRLANLAELVAVVIANAQHRADLSASRARLVVAADEARRRIQRDLHDGAQQRLVGTVLALKLARKELGDATGPVVELVDEALAQAEQANGELRELAHGILPGALTRGGLRAGIESLVSRTHLKMTVDVTSERFPAALEATAYFIVAEALTNAVRHAQATSARIAAAVDDGRLRLEVRDDGIGGARMNGSSGLLGLRDRAAAVNGTLWFESPPDHGTCVAAMLPIAAAQAA